MGVVLERTQNIGGIVESYKNDRHDDYYVALHAKHNCKRCLGRGRLHFDHPGKGTAWVELCGCVHR